jgi:hypothetical protein
MRIWKRPKLGMAPRAAKPADMIDDVYLKLQHGKGFHNYNEGYYGTYTSYR